VTSRDVVDPVLDLPAPALVVQRVRGGQTSGQVGRGGQALGAKQPTGGAPSSGWFTSTQDQVEHMPVKNDVFWV